jgi:hypothetical protein
VEPERFIDDLVSEASGGELPPFRYYSAYVAAQRAKTPKGGDPQAIPIVLEAIKGAMLAALVGKGGPRFPGRLIALADNSGSARGKTPTSMGKMSASTVGNLTAVMAAMQADVGMIGVFGDRLRTFRARKSAPVLEQLARAERIGRRVGGRTEHGVWLFWDEAIRKRQRWDTIFVLSDMQAGHGALYGLRARDYRQYLWAKHMGNAYIDVPGLIATYREEVNPAVMVYLVQIDGHQETIVPEFYERTYVLGGWGEAVLSFAAEMAGLYRVPLTK